MKVRVLIAEDEPAHTEAIRRSLETCGLKAEVRVTGTLSEFRELAAAAPPDVALMDLNLSDGRAVEFLTTPPEAGPFPVVIMTSFGNEAIAVEAMKSGALDYVVKSPEAFAGLPRTLERALREWKLLQDRRRTEEALKKSEARYRRAQQAAHIGIWEWDIPADRLFWSEEMFVIYDQDRQRFIPTNQTVMDCLVPDDQAVAAKAVEASLKNGAPFEVQYRIKDSHQQIKWILAKGEVLFDGQGRPLSAAGTVRDITAEKQAEERLQESHQRFEMANRATFDAIWDLNLRTHTVWRNENFQTLFGYRTEELEPTMESWVHCIHPEDVERVEAGIFKAIDSGQKFWSDQYRFRRKDGAYAIVEDRGLIERDPAGKPVRMIGAMQDITERRHREETLRESEERYRDLVENSQDLICTHDLEGKLLSLNEAAAKQMGYDRESLLNRNLRDFLEPAVRHLFAGYLSEIKETGRSQGILRVLNAAGEIRIWEYQNTLRTDGLAAPLVRGMAHDITERQRAEEALRKSEAKYRRLYDSLMDAFVSVDMTGRITEFNQAYASLLGYPAEELHRLTYEELTPVRWHSLERDLVENQILTRGYSDIYEKEYRRKDGFEFPVEMRTFLIRDSNGRAEGMWAIVRDISERKGVEAALRKTEEKYSKAFRASPDWVVITTLDEGVFIEVNNAFERLSGFGREEVLGRTAAAIGIWDQPEERDRLTDLLQREGSVYNMEVRFRQRSGAVGTFLLSADVIELEGLACMLTVARDMTELRSLEGQLRQAQKMEAVGRLAGGVAHDFNNMLGVILGYTDLALKRLNAQEPLYHDLQEVHQAARRSADLTRQLLAFSRKQIVIPRVVNLNEAVTQQQKMLGRLIGEDIALKFIPGQDLWNIRLDPSQVDQVLANLAVNARDAIAGVGTVTIETANVTLDERYTRRYPYSTPGDHVRLVVSDSGSGMEPETLERIFEPFFTTKGEGQGTGLGLSTVYGIVKQNGGSIQAYSEPGLGTTFKIYFPRFLGEAVPVQDAKVTPLSGSETVLIVEDESMILLLAKRVLEHYGYKTVGADSPGEALLLLEKHQGPLHLLLTDVIMPNMTGPELKGRVEALHPGIKTLFMSGYPSEVIAQRGLLEEGLDFIQKPFSVQDLARTVRRVLDS